MSRRDSQKQKLYDWEHKHLKKSKKLSKEECESMVRTLNRHTKRLWRGKIGPVSVNILKRYGRNSWTDGREISLRTWGMTPEVIFHEYAHCCVGVSRGHGKEFVGCLLALVTHYLGKDRILMAKTLNEHNIDFESSETWRKKLGLNGRHSLRNLI